MRTEVYRREDGLWAWRIRATNGQIIATDGGQGYSRKKDARVMAERFTYSLPIEARAPWTAATPREVSAAVAAQRLTGQANTVVFREGNSEEFVESPIGFSYDREGRLVVTYEPSWEDIARRFSPLPVESTEIVEDES